MLQLPMHKHITLLKLGGALITNKEVPNQLRPDVLRRLAQEIARAMHDNPDLRLVIGNGVGSYAHVPAARYKTMDGFIHEDSKIGMAITQDSAAQINREVVAALIAEELPAVSVSPSNCLVTANKKAATYFTDVFEQYLQYDLLPVTHGDVIVDTQQGCTIWSTDTVFTFFAQEFVKRGWRVNEIIHVTEANGVWKMHEGKPLELNGRKEIFETITPAMRDEVKASMLSTKGFDVTGGMWHKLEEALLLTKLGITTRILSGLEPELVYKTLVGSQLSGTQVTA